MSESTLSPKDKVCHLVEKDVELKLLQEKYSNCAKALVEEQRRSERYIRLLMDKNLASGPPCHKPTLPPSGEKIASAEEFTDEQCETDISTDGDVGLAGSLVGRSPAMVHPPVGVPSVTRGVRQSRLETDDATFMEMYRPAPELPEVMAMPKFNSKTGTKSHEKKPVQSENDGRVPAATAEKKHTSCKPAIDEQLLDEVKDAIITTADTESNAHTLGPIQFPDISGDLLDKVMQQNARLKKVLRRVVDLQGISLQDFIEMSDYTEIIERLKLEIVTLQSQVKEQHQLLQADDNQLRQKCDLLVDQVHRLEHKSTIQQTLVDVYSSECDKLKSELKQLHATCGGRSQTVNAASATTESSSSQTRSNGQGHNEFKELIEQFVQLRSKYCEMENFYREKLRKVEEQLKDKTNAEEQLKQKIETLTLECERKERMLNELEEEQVQLAKLVRDTATATKQFKRYNTVPCAVAECRQNPLSCHLPREGLVADGDSADDFETERQAAHSEKRNASLPTILPYAASQSEQLLLEMTDSASFVCKRCEMQFTDEQKYHKHCKKCIDD